MQTTNYPWLKSYPQEVDWHEVSQPKPLYSLLEESAAHFAEKTLIDFLGKRYSYKEIEHLAARMARGLEQAGVKKGSKVGLLLPNCPLFVIAYFAIVRLGAVVVNYNPLYSLKELQYQVEDSETTVMVTLDLKVLYHKANTLLHTTVLEKVIVGSMEEMLPFPQNKLFALFKKAEIAEVNLDTKILSFSDMIAGEVFTGTVEIDPLHDPVVLQYTGGTTGTPKGALLTHANIYTNVMQTSRWLYSLKEGEERILGVLPLFHIFAMTAIMHIGIKKGACLMLYPKFYADKVVQDIKRKKITIMPTVPTLLAAILGVPGVEAKHFTSLRLAVSGGAPLPSVIREQFEQLSGCQVVQGYGLTETSPIVAVQPLNGAAKQGSVGLPMPGTVVEIEDMENPGHMMPTGQMGEICIRGPQVMQGYLHHMDDTARALDKNGRFHSGDIGYLDADGYLFVVDRLKEMIISGGYKIYPHRVEDAIYMHHAVKEAAVIGIADEYRGQVVKAFIVCKEGHTLDVAELSTFLKPKLAVFEIPAVVECMEVLPKTLIGKVAKKELKR